MALFREHVDRRGRAKIAWDTKGEALEACPLNQNVHQCGLCGKWHRHRISTPRLPKS